MKWQELQRDAKRLTATEDKRGQIVCLGDKVELKRLGNKSEARVTMIWEVPRYFDTPHMIFLDNYATPVPQSDIRLLFEDE